MKNVLIKISAVLLVLWYVMSIIGFDVHTCRETGHSIVHISLTSHSCDDIHHSDNEHSHHHDSGCCDDEYKVISLTGLRSDEDTDILHGSYANLYPFLQAEVSENLFITADSDLHECAEIPDLGLIVPDIQVLFNVWRI